MIQLQLTRTGGVRMLHDDLIDLGEFGEPIVTRASHVEFCNTRGGWTVSSAKTGRLLAVGFPTRAEALAWEKNHYSPTGKGWSELTGGPTCLILVD